MKSDTTPIEQSFNSASARPSYSGHLPSTLSRQDTEQDALQIMTNNMNLRQEDLASVGTDDEEDDKGVLGNANGNGGALSNKRRKYPLSMTNGNGLESQAELLTSKELFGVSRTSFEKDQISNIISTCHYSRTTSQALHCRKKTRYTQSISKGC